MSRIMTISPKPSFKGTLKGEKCCSWQRKSWKNNIREWTSLPMPKQLMRASRRKDWEKISAESSLMCPWQPNQPRDWTELIDLIHNLESELCEWLYTMLDHKAPSSVTAGLKVISLILFLRLHESAPLTLYCKAAETHSRQTLTLQCFVCPVPLIISSLLSLNKPGLKFNGRFKTNSLTVRIKSDLFYLLKLTCLRTLAPLTKHYSPCHNWLLLLCTKQDCRGNLDGQHQRLNIPAHARTVHNGRPQKRLDLWKRVSAKLSFMSPWWPDQSRDWSEECNSTTCRKTRKTCMQTPVTNLHGRALSCRVQ